MSLIIFLYGFITVASQVVFFRELLVLCGGNELSMGMLLSAWFGWTALGSFLGGVWIRKSENEVQKFRIMLGILPIVLFGTIILLRFGRVIFGLMVGELADLTEILLITVLFLCPICLVSGMLFPVFVEMCSALNKISFQQSINRVYFLEGIGAGIGGLCLTFIILWIWTSMEIMFFLFWLCWLMLFFTFTYKKSILFRFSIVILITVFHFLILFPLAKKIDRFTVQFAWKGYTVHENINTVYGNLVVTGEEKQRNFYENGSLLFASGDVFSAEELIHFPLLQHPAPEKILLIGGGINGGVRQIIKHPTVVSVDYVELDPSVIRLGKQYLSEEEIPPVSDSRIRTIFADGRQWVQSINKKYDVIILGLPDPSSALFNRFYTLEFFKNCHKILNENGIIAFRVTSSENYISEALKDFLGTIYQTLSMVFPSILMIPGNTMYFLACTNNDVLTDNYQTLLDRLSDRRIETLYFKGYYISDRMSQERMVSARKRVLEFTGRRINTDFYPVGYYYQMVLWSSLFSQKIRDFFTALSRLPSPAILFTFFLGLFFLPVLSIRRRKVVAFSVIVVGFSMIAFEIIILIGVQVLYGYLFSQIALLIACFMIGLAYGARRALKWIEIHNAPYAILYKVQFVIVLFSVLLIGYFGIMPFVMESFNTLSIYLGCLFFMTIAGFLGGVHFQFANAVFSASAEDTNKGVIYALDLAGSCSGAVIVSVFLIPLAGLLQTTGILCIWNMAAFVLLIIYRKKLTVS